MSRSILFITEGLRDEPKVVKRMMKLYPQFDDFDVVTVNGSIYEIMELMFGTDDDLDDISIRTILNMTKSIQAGFSFTDRKFTDIVLLFDMDPHHQKYERYKDRIPQLLRFFNDSTDNGKLYINYPMLQSFYHITDFDDGSYLVSEYSGDMSRYKEHVGMTGLPELKDISKIQKETFDRIIRLNLEKLALLSGTGIPNAKVYMESGLDIELWDRETRKWKESKSVDIICTMVFFVIDYDADSYFENESG